MRKSDFFFLSVAIEVIFIIAIFIHSSVKIKDDAALIAEKSLMVKRLGITDLCLFTEARYARHPSMADWSTPFQDYPLSLDHFPSGSLLTPPAMLRKGGNL